MWEVGGSKQFAKNCGVKATESDSPICPEMYLPYWPPGQRGSAGPVIVVIILVGDPHSISSRLQLKVCDILALQIYC